MLKRFILPVFAVLVAFQGFSQFEEGDKYLHLGIGLGSPFLYSGSKMGIPPVHASFEAAVSDKFGVGGLIGYTSSSIEETYALLGSYSWKFSYLIIGARGAYHFYSTDKLDTYGGVMLGYNVASATFESDDSELESLISEPAVGGLAFGGYLGARVNFSDNAGAFAEVGYNIAWASLGVALKF